MTRHSEVVSLTKQLIRRPSITPEDAGCQALLVPLLEDAGFRCESLDRGNVSNLWARYGTAPPLLCFAGHTDVVPPGELSHWDSDPFIPRIDHGLLYGRGAADMKGGLSAMVTAARRFVAQNSTFAGSIALLITSDEEGIAVDGTRAAIEKLQQREESIDWCVVGEPSSNVQLGDQMRIGRRGSLSGHLIVNGQQGHAAYPEKLINPVTRFAPLMNALCNYQWDHGSDRFPPTSFQFVCVESDGGALNVTPAQLTAKFNFRFSNQWQYESLEREVESVISGYLEDYELEWTRQGTPFLTNAGELIDAGIRAIEDTCGIAPALSTGGGTSDGRFIAPTGAEVIEIGPVNASIHQVNEHVAIADLDRLVEIYSSVARRLLLPD